MEGNLVNLSTNGSLNNSSNPTRYNEVVYILVIISCLGIVENLLIVFAFWSSRCKSINVLLIGEAVFEIIARLSSTVWNVDYLFRVDRYKLVWTGSYYLLCIGAVVRTALIWTTVVINLERYMAVCRPFEALTYCSATKSKLILIIISILSAGFNMCRFWENKIVSGKIVRFLTNDPFYIEFYSLWLSFVFKFMLPFMILVIVNIFIVTTLFRRKRASQIRTHHENRCDYKTSFMILLFTFSFLFFNLSPFFHHFFAASCFRWRLKFCETFTLYKPLIIHVVNVMITLNGCMPFFIYFVCCGSFRSRLRYLFACKRGNRTPNLSLSRQTC